MAVTKMPLYHLLNNCLTFIGKLGLILTAVFVYANTTFAAILPEQKVDLLLDHGYEGGGMKIHGPSVLVRKNLGNNFSVWGNHYEDIISSASVDVITQGSPDGIEEHRSEQSLGVDILNNKTLMGFFASQSEERDYSAKTFGASVSHDFFGDLTTLSLKYSRGQDEVRENIYSEGVLTHTDYRGEATHQRYGISLTQILTRYMIISLSGESVVDDGFLNNPYRYVRSTDSEGGAADTKERYPTTRTSDAFALRSMIYLPYRAAVKLEYRAFSDSWGIDAFNYEIKYTHPLKKKWTFELKYRFYSQTKADFFADAFLPEFLNEETGQNFLASDKEMDALTNNNGGLGITYQFDTRKINWIKKATANLFWDRMFFKYENYRDRSLSEDILFESSQAPFAKGEEPIYSFEADVIRFFVTAWY